MIKYIVASAITVCLMFKYGNLPPETEQGLYIFCAFMAIPLVLAILEEPRTIDSMAYRGKRK